jgi:hypothetical protein
MMQQDDVPSRLQVHNSSHTPSSEVVVAVVVVVVVSYCLVDMHKNNQHVCTNERTRLSYLPSSCPANNVEMPRNDTPLMVKHKSSTAIVITALDKYNRLELYIPCLWWLVAVG